MFNNINNGAMEPDTFLGTSGQGGCHHAGRHTPYNTLKTRELLDHPQVISMREQSDAVEELCQRLEGRR